MPGEQMRILFDMVDTAHVHFFKTLIRELKAGGHEVLVTARQKDVTLDLLDKFGIEYRSISKRGTGLLGLAWELFTRYFRLFRAVRKFRPDVMLAKNGGASIGPIGALMRIPRLVFEDTEHAKLQRAIGLPFATCIITGSGYLKDLGPRQKRFKGVWVQTYLDPKYFTPDAKVLERYGIEPDKPYIVIRTVAWEAAHDVGHKGTSAEALGRAVEKLSRFGRVIICAETPLPDSLKEYANPLPVELVHHLLAFAALYIGEGGSMASEAAVLGTPAVFCNPLYTGCGCHLAMEKDYGLVCNTDTLDKGVEIAEGLLSKPDLGELWRAKQRKFLDESDDLVELMMGLIEDAARKRRAGS